MSRKKIIIIASILVIIVLAGVVYFLFLKQGKQEMPVVDVGDRQQDQQDGLPLGEDEGDTRQDQIDENRQPSQEEKDSSKVKSKSRFFVSMLGTYSPDANFQNIIDLKPLMSGNMQEWADNFIEGNRENGNNNETVSTQVLNAEVLELDNGSALVLVFTRRHKTANGETKLYNSEAQVELVKIGRQWLVDGVEWR